MWHLPHGYVGIGDKEPTVAVAPYPIALGYVSVVDFDITVAVGAQLIAGAWCGRRDKCGITFTLALAVAVAYEEAVNQRIVGCACPCRKGEDNRITQAKVGRYIAKEEANGGVTDTSRLRQRESKGLVGIHIGGMGDPYIAARSLEADVIRDPRSVGKRRQAARREVQTKTGTVNNRKV